MESHVPTGRYPITGQSQNKRANKLFAQSMKKVKEKVGDRAKVDNNNNPEVSYTSLCCEENMTFEVIPLFTGKN